MATSGAVQCSLSFTKGNLSEALEAFLQFVVTGTDCVHKTQQIGNTEEAIQLGSDIGTNGWFMAINRDPTNSIYIRSGTAAADFLEMKPGEPCLFRLKATAPYAITSASTCQLEYLLIEA